MSAVNVAGSALNAICSDPVGQRGIAASTVSTCCSEYIASTTAQSSTPCDGSGPA